MGLELEHVTVFVPVGAIRSAFTCGNCCQQHALAGGYPLRAPGPDPISQAYIVDIVCSNSGVTS
ncbi:hypothetical protein HLY00_3821 [Mycolicibacterium hippocampi]|uniref:Uncharacterized protein n=1 Tax=Mycolicibacterium hippocampi TaxID=659824 RepID=A0A850PYG8_9MYCO|nr:hypothetical protein [Mycolicibacterium hippocampi]